MSFLVRRYMASLEHQPLLIKSITAGVVAFGGDALAQTIESPGSWNAPRSIQLGLYGLFVAGPLTHAWYQVLERIAGGGNSLKTALTKAAMDQSMAAPLFTGIFFAVNSLMAQIAESRTVSLVQVHNTLARNWWSTLLVNWTFWPAMMLVGMKYVPLNLRVLYGNVLGVFWGAYLSHTLHEPVAE